ncbi:single-pass membrane and coiled-coil domain-containing protein 4 homolog [Onthophagus taurus]|uniref:single-pass membrane and coiled-coil domain-containing protein 4 homolog n=1 Tax=Onthophagus taurus TaxID=166361 RepID=UPI000C20359A|nr:single-pass membrane and coiled-coil domain-containing protein 4 homolog [Onthophagus taurus]
MRQSKGKQKETSKDKKQRKKDFEDIQRQVYTVVIPAVIGILIFIAGFVYMKTRPQSYINA